MARQVPSFLIGRQPCLVRLSDQRDVTERTAELPAAEAVRFRPWVFPAAISPCSLPAASFRPFRLFSVSPAQPPSPLPENNNHLYHKDSIL